MYLRALIVEDDEWLRQDIAASLRADAAFDVCEVGTGSAAIAAAKRAAPDVALVDLGLPDMGGIELISALRRISEETACVVLTIFDDAHTAFGALRAGARGYLVKSVATDRLAAALREARDGGMVLSPPVAQLVMEQALLGAPSEPAALTTREVELLRLLARGHTYAECGHSLGIGLGTVQSHVKSIYAKLAVSSKAEAAVAALRLGVL